MKKYLYLRFMFICLQMWTSVSPVHVKMAPFVKILLDTLSVAVSLVGRGSFVKQVGLNNLQQ